jgi:glucose/arabinose dehydrogenase
MMPRYLRISLFTVLAVLMLLVAAAALLTRSGPYAVSDIGVLWAMVTGRGGDTPTPAQVATRLQAPPGFTVSTWATGVAGARMLAVTAAGDLLVSQPRSGRITLLGADRNGDGAPDRRVALLDGLDRPHGIELHDGWLYVAEQTRVSRVRFDAAQGTVAGAPENVVDGLPGGGNHWSKSLRIGTDGTLYVAVGSTCNVCIEKDERRATILRFDADGRNGRVFARGLRNSVGLDFAPWDGALYATDNGRDLLGDDFPPCELNRIEDGAFYGWPYVNGFGRLDPDLGRGREALAAASRAPVHGFRAHNAPLGVRFLRASPRPPGFERAALVALHGSWNRSKPDGYRVVSLHWRDDGTIEERPFLTGFLERGSVIGRPVDIAEAADGTLYVSDDFAGVIYRLRYSEAAVAGSVASG